MNKVLFFMIFIFVTVFSVFSEEELMKKYYNNVFNGGKERIIFNNTDSTKNILILSSNVTVDLYEDYSKVTIIYKIKNNSKDAKVTFLYPKIDTEIKKSYEILDQKEKNEIETKSESFKINGDYKDFLVSVNNEKMNYTIEDSNINETKIPFKLGDTKEYSESITTFYKESIESFSYIYKWYSIPLSFSQKETKTILISYITGNYYNENCAKNYKNEYNIEDPALNYEFYEKDSKKFCISEKVFSFYLFTNYSQIEMPAKSNIIKINSHIIDSDYLKIFPKNYSKSGKSFLWKYKNLKSKSLNNIIVKISPLNSENTISQRLFKVYPEKKQDGLNTFYEIKNGNEFILLENNDIINVREIRLLPDFFVNKSSVNDYNKPLEIEVSFSKKSDFSDAVKFIKKISQKEYFNLINKKNYITIFKNKPVSCKYIRIKVLKTSDDKNNTVKINDIEILK